MYVFKSTVKDRIIRLYREQHLQMKHNGHGMLMDSDLKITDILLIPEYSTVRIISKPLISNPLVK